ncbi:ATP-grasp fold amidoligase family protein [Peribacillus frigoritolerans]|uniref:ATP-grasp fold amidoligase family protein n=1 Tax=Peribacillus frigoritolerans TaxID=450367 RepID=UPI00227E670A|nr:ATP-grasp fold amidoligase family protein [Peribacillus frigoritolerans]MCY9140976.1 carbonic anhydrase [Peribacillus frigoritolerans]
MDYRKIIKSKEMRFRILHYLRFIPDSLMLKLQYRMKMGRKLNLKKPKRWTEKLQWYKLYYRTPLMTQCADKHDVREYIKSKGLEDILNKLYAVYSSADQFKLDSLPQKFVIKTTNGSGTNILCKDKKQLNLNNVKQSLNEWMSRDNYSVGREWSYKGIVPKIIVEEYLEDKKNPFDGINDYKFICFNGRAKYIVFDVDRHIDHKRNIYDTDWKFIDINTDYPNFGDCVSRPEGLDEMLRVANILASDFPFVRVDLYWVNGKVYFGELTFYPWTGYVQFDPDEFDFILGDQFILSKKY